MKENKIIEVNKTVKMIGSILVLIGVILGIWRKYGLVIVGIGLIFFYCQDLYKEFKK